MAFKEWASHEGLTSSCSLEQFRGSRIAIDAEDYLTSLLTAPLTREPLLPALGGLPFALQKYVDGELHNFKDAGITPVFVFNGLDLASRDRSVVGKEARKASSILNDAWSIYDQGKGDDAVAAFGKACTYRTYHILRWLQAYLHRSGVSVLTAPYNAAAQMAYLDNNGFVDAVVGSASSLLFGGERVITSFDWEGKRVVWVDLKDCQEKLLLNRDQFTDLMLLSGCAVLPPFPEIDLEASPIVRVQSTRALLNRFNQDGHAACLQKNDPEYLDAFGKAKYAMKHPVVLTVDGKIEPRDADKVPNDVHEFIGQRLPDEVYYYLSRGVIGPRVLNWRTRMQLYETPPLDGGISQTYRELVQEKLRLPRAQALALVTSMLHRYYHKVDVDLICWFSESEKRPLGIPDMVAEPSDSEKMWDVREATITASEAELNASPLSCAVHMLSNEGVARQTVSERANDVVGILSKPKETLLNTVFRFLYDRGYINPDHTLSAWGRALKYSLDRANSNGFSETALSPNEVEEAVFMAFELLRLDVLNNKNMFPTPPYTGQPLRGSETDTANTLFISRIACLGLFKHESIGYTGPLSRHLLAYHQVTAAVRGSLRDLVETHACNMLLSGAVSRDVPPAQLTDLGARLPFLREPDLGLALVVKSYLDEGSDALRRSDITKITKWFNHAVDIHGDLEKAWKIWDAVNAGVQTGDSSIISSETRKLFKNTDEWLERRRASGPATNGTT